MIGLIISDTHLLYGEWISADGTYSLEDLKYVPFSKPIKELIKSKENVNNTLKSAIEGLPLNGKEVVIAIDDDLLFHDKFATDESVSNNEIWEYIQWETKQKWGELGNYYTTFAEKDSPSTSVLHCVTCPTFLISVIKTIVADKHGNPMWAGPVSSIYLDNKDISNAVYMLDDESFIRFYFRGRDGYSEGKLRFVGGQPTVSVVVGNKDEQTKLFNVKNDVFKFVTIDLISESKNSNIRQYKPQRMIPFENVEVRVEDIPEDVSFKLLNVLSILIKDFSYKYLINFFSPNQVQEKQYEGLGELGFDEEGERIEKPANTAQSKVKKENLKAKPKETKPKKLKKETKPDKKVKKEKVKKDKKRNSSSLILFIILIVAIGYYLFFNENGKEILSKAKESIGIEKTSDNSETMMFYDTQFNQSTAIIKSYNELTSIVSPDSIISFVLLGNSGSIEFVGTDSIDVPIINPVDYLLEPIDCCGGIKQHIEFDIGYMTGEKRNNWINSDDMIDQLENTFQIEQIRILENVIVNDVVYKPIIVEATSLELINKLVKYLEFIGDNVIVRKISMTNTPPGNDINATFYISVFEPL